MLLAFVVCLALQAQQPDTRAKELRALIAATPRLALEQVAIAPELPMRTVSSVAAGRNGVIYILQRGDKADPVIAVNRDGRVLRSWGKGMFTVPHGIRVDDEEQYLDRRRRQFDSAEVFSGGQEARGDRSG